MTAESHRRKCPQCGLETARVERDLVLCGACGSVTVEGARPSPRASRPPWPIDTSSERGDDEPFASRRTIVVRGLAIVVAVVGTIAGGLVLAFLVRGEVNVRYVGTLVLLVSLVGIFAVAAVAWAAGDPNSPLRHRPRRPDRDRED